MSMLTRTLAGVVAQSHGSLHPTTTGWASRESYGLDIGTGMRPRVLQGMGNLSIRLLWRVARVWLG